MTYSIFLSLFAYTTPLTHSFSFLTSCPLGFFPFLFFFMSIPLVLCLSPLLNPINLRVHLPCHRFVLIFPLKSYFYVFFLIHLYIYSLLLFPIVYQLIFVSITNINIFFNSIKSIIYWFITVF